MTVAVQDVELGSVNEPLDVYVSPSFIVEFEMVFMLGVVFAGVGYGDTSEPSVYRKLSRNAGCPLESAKAGSGSGY